MKFRDMVEEDAIRLNLHVRDKQEALECLYEMLYRNGSIRKIEPFAAAVEQRERSGMTGIGGMLAIPHGCAETVTRNCVAIGLLAHPVVWESVDQQPVRAVLLFAIRPDSGQTHLRAMAAVAQFFGREEYRQQLFHCRTKRGLYRLLSEMPEGDVESRLHLVAVTACPAGVAHTYISRECLIQAALARHHSIKVETQGAVGVENRLSPAEIREADVVIIAADIEIEGPERFEGKRMVRIPVSAVIGSADALMEQIEQRLGFGEGGTP